MVKIRLAKGGKIHRPIYTIVVADSRSPRDGRFLEKLGQYDPQRGSFSNLKLESLVAWAKKGAKLSDTVSSILKKNKISYV
jgi:small subunit ribosomal protein S16